MQKHSNSQNDKRKREKKLAEAIMNYLAENPHASDTLEGIAEWWIMRQQVRVEIDTLENALHQLINGGFLEKIGEGKKAQYHLKIQKSL